MIEWLNAAMLFISTPLSMYIYSLSVRPATLEKKMGERAYPRCALYRVISSVFMFVAIIGYVLYTVYPLPLPLPLTFPWEYWIAALLAVIILAPSAYLMIRGAKDAGEETLVPKKEHTLYGGIYQRIRHPQALGEAWVALVVALLLNSPFLVLFSFVWFPMFYWVSLVEERDLVIRYGQLYIDYRGRTGMFIPKRKPMNPQ